MDCENANTSHPVFRVLQVLTLIPCWAVLAALIDVYNKSNSIPPAGVICLFVVTLLASVWSFCVLVASVRARNTALWMAFFDIGFMIAIIVGVALLSNIVNVTCITMYQDAVYTDGEKVWGTSGGGSGATVGNGGDSVWRSTTHCALAKAAWGLAITDIIMFFVTAVLAVVIYKQNQDRDLLTRDKVYTTRVVDPYTRGPRRHRHHHHHRGGGGYIVEERI